MYWIFSENYIEESYISQKNGNTASEAWDYAWEELQAAMLVKLES